MDAKKKKIIKNTALVLSGVGVIVAVVMMIRNSNASLRDYKSKYYTLADMFRSDTAANMGIKNTTEDETYILNMKALFKNVLDPLCDKYGKRIPITSGFRTKELNDMIIGSSAGSQHMKGEAVDLDMGLKSENMEIFDLLKEMGNFDQLIDENDMSWVHVSYKRNGINRGDVIRL